MHLPLSKKLEVWIGSPGDKTLAGFAGAFIDQTFAMLFLILMVWPATPLPTGGLTHVFEVITMLLALEMAAGRQFWLPKRWMRLRLDRVKGLPAMPRLVARFEKVSRPRLARLMSYPYSGQVSAAAVFVFTLAAFLAPPFSALDTLPSIGVLLIALALLTRDGAAYLLGWVAGTLGIIVEIGLGNLAYRWLF